jgi:plastocyanin
MRTRAAALILGVMAASCGGSSSPAAPDPTPSNPYTFTITASGVAPKEFTVSPGTRVLFVNNDTRSHDMASDPHPEHSDCPELNRGALSPGQSRESLNLIAVRTCGFHDHDNPENTSLKGRIIIK